MNAHYLQHVPFEGLGSMKSWLAHFGYKITQTRFFESATLPDISAFDLLVVLGGPMSVNNEKEFPWLAAEKRLIREAIDRRKAVLGICLGAQLIASATGARVYQNGEKEIGWFPVRGLSLTDDAVFRFPASVDAFHWHGETFDLPEGAVHLARSEGCRNQAFQLGASVLGLQFHLETTPESARELVFSCRNELAPSTFVQTEADILAAGLEKYRVANQLMNRVLSFITKEV